MAGGELAENDAIFYRGWLSESWEAATTSPTGLDGDRLGMAQKHTTVRDGRRLLWYTERLWESARELEPFEMAIADIPEVDQDCWFSDREPTVRRVAEHCRRILEADLGHPIILNADGSLMDGGHRICRVLLDGGSTIQAVQFETSPEPDEVWEQDPGTDHA